MAIRRFTPKHNFAGADFVGLLLAVTPSKYNPNAEEGARNGVMHADVVVCDGDRAGETHKDLRIVQLSLIDGLKEGGPGETTVFRLTAGTSTAGNPLWVMNEPTDDDVASAERILTGKPMAATARKR